MPSHSWKFGYCPNLPQYVKSAKNHSLALGLNDSYVSHIIWIWPCHIYPYYLNMTMSYIPILFEYDHVIYTHIIWVWPCHIYPYYLNMTISYIPILFEYDHVIYTHIIWIWPCHISFCKDAKFNSVCNNI